jgi:hypothetical protein
MSAYVPAALSALSHLYADLAPAGIVEAVAPVKSSPDCREPLIVGVTTPIFGLGDMLPITVELLPPSLVAITLTNAYPNNSESVNVYVLLVAPSI